MFDGNNNCSICKKEMTSPERNFRVSLSGYTYVFCKSCTSERKEDIIRMLGLDSD